MDVVSKVVKILKRHSAACQFGEAPKIGCQDIVFTIQSFLQERREKQLDTCVVFIYLFKMCDRIQHNVINDTLNVFGVPRDVNAWIMKLCRNGLVVLKFGSINNLTSCGCSAEQGDSLAPALLTIVTQLAAKDLESELKKSNIKTLKDLVSSKVKDAIRQHMKNDTTNVTNNDTNPAARRRRCYPI